MLPKITKQALNNMSARYPTDSAEQGITYVKNLAERLEQDNPYVSKFLNNSLVEGDTTGAFAAAQLYLLLEEQDIIDTGYIPE